MRLCSRLSILLTLTISVLATTLLTQAAIVSSEYQTMTGSSVAVPFRGEWVPARARCTSPLKLIIGANVVTFLHGNDREEFRRLEQCFSCMGHDVENITILSTDAMGDSPFMIYLDGSKKKAALTVDFADKKLGARFRLGTAALKKCK